MKIQKFMNRPEEPNEHSLRILLRQVQIRNEQ